MQRLSIYIVFGGWVGRGGGVMLGQSHHAVLGTMCNCTCSLTLRLRLFFSLSPPAEERDAGNAAACNVEQSTAAAICSLKFICTSPFAFLPGALKVVVDCIRAEGRLAGVWK